MVIIVREVSDADIPRVAAIETAAYAINALRPILFPGPFPPDSEQQRVVELTNARKNDPTATYLQAYDEETGQLVAFAKWHIYDTPEKAAAAQRPSRTFGAGTNSKACEAFFGGLAARKKELMGQKTHIRRAFTLVLIFQCHAKAYRSSHATYRPNFPGTGRWWHARGMGYEKS